MVVVVVDAAAVTMLSPPPLFYVVVVIAIVVVVGCHYHSTQQSSFLFDFCNFSTFFPHLLHVLLVSSLSLLIYRCFWFFAESCLSLFLVTRFDRYHNGCPRTMCVRACVFQVWYFFHPLFCTISLDHPLL